ncbi:MAG: hypothetical protein ACR2FF_06355 [Mycobacteriales bacterium]
MASIVWGWGIAQYPHLLPGLDVAGAQAPSSTLHARLVACAVGVAVVVPSMGRLFRTFQRPH